ncbi:TetR/AcrR family transcriptional regulator [Sporosarcina sp. Te-1]|uniref:TetR/AcrR family transcriptional regulator n=1 Tax=Sporosarcina sp. Te-1 TaxID=2818390 RepID=UPI001A9FDD7D|nr:TetR/AcrR family transcriptional regulator [Sporosarcina sp. Te-1]QTD41774.1 TetR/AcrR family transcriptional regulator [Sporosarcina sp. Te-1]
MAKGFSEEERILINEQLLNSAEECWSIYGLKKTTVDELVKRVGISKGAFYLFYPSKELLFFKVLERIDERVKCKMLENAQASNEEPKQIFIHTVQELFLEIQKNPWLLNLQNGDYEHIIKKLPKEEIAQHLKKDEEGIARLLTYLNIDHDSGFVSSALKSIFFTLLHKNEIGEDHFDQVIQLFIKSLANQLFEEA